jgi:hypothetical protein
MHIAKRFSPSVPAHRHTETEAAVWIMIVVLLGIVSFAMVSLFERIGG